MSNVPAADGGSDPDSIQTAADFARALQALRDQSGLRIREMARLTGGQRSTVGGYFSGQHLPLDRELLARLLVVCGENDPARIERWQLALLRVRRRPRRRSEAPYRGLARYEEADAQWFFGRDDVTGLLVSLGTAPSELPLLLIGPSGAGKSSVLRAGLLPRLNEMGRPAEVVDLSVSGVRELTKLAAKLIAEEAGPETAAGDARRSATQGCGSHCKNGTWCSGRWPPARYGTPQAARSAGPYRCRRGPRRAAARRPRPGRPGRSRGVNAVEVRAVPSAASGTVRAKTGAPAQVALSGPKRREAHRARRVDPA